MNQFDNFRLPTPSEVAREMDYIKMGERDTEEMLRRAEIARQAKWRQRIEWVVVFVIVLGMVLTMEFCGFGR
jgi:uncharacterized membrane protein